MNDTRRVERDNNLSVREMFSKTSFNGDARTRLQHRFPPGTNRQSATKKARELRGMLDSPVRAEAISQHAWPKLNHTRERFPFKVKQKKKKSLE